MTITHLPSSGRSIVGFPIPANRFDGENVGLGVFLRRPAAIDRNLMLAVKRAANEQGVRIAGEVSSESGKIIGMDMPSNPVKLFGHLGFDIGSLKTRGNQVDLADRGDVLQRFSAVVRGMAEAGEADFAPVSLGSNLLGAAVEDRMFGRTFKTSRTDLHRSWDRHSDGYSKLYGNRLPLYMHARTDDDWRALARTLVARLDVGGSASLGGGELNDILKYGPVGDAEPISMELFREAIEEEVATAVASGVAQGRGTAQKLSEGFPAFSDRSGHRLKMAQFSTPPLVGKIASEFLKPAGKVLLEPTIGNGVLAAASVHVGALAVGMELDGERAARARRALPDAKIVEGSATGDLPDNPISETGRYGSALVNPPYARLDNGSDQEFSSVVDLASIGHKFPAKSLETLISAKAIEKLEVGGDAVFVMPAAMIDPSEISGSRAKFQALLNLSFEQVDSVVLGAHLYKSMGSNYPVIVHFAEGKRAPDDVPALSEVRGLMPDSYPVVNSFDDFAAFGDRLLDHSGIDALPEDVQVANRAAFLGEDLKNEDAPAPVDDLDRDADQGASDVGSSPSGPVTHSGVAGRGVGGEGRSGTEIVEVEPDGGLTLSEEEPEGVGSPHDGGDLSMPSSDYNVSFFLDDFEGDPFSVPYQPFSEKKGAKTVIERTMEAATYQALRLVTNKYGSVDRLVAQRLGLDKDFLISDAGPLSAEQIDGVALQFYNRDMGRGVIAGDLMGVGKGRQLAANMIDAWMQGRPVLAMTNKGHLFRDLVVRDVAAVAQRSFQSMLEDGDVRPFVFNADAESRLTEKDGKTVVFATSAQERKAVQADGLDPDLNLVLSTYSQFQIASSAAWRLGAIRDWIDAWADKGAPPVIELDEVHEAAGPDSRTGAMIRDLLEHAKSRGADIVYSSATSMKSGKNIGVYKHALPDTGLSMDQLMDVVEQNPLAMQEVLSTEMARSGTMIQRKMSSAGVERDTVLLADLDVTKMQEARAMSEDFASKLRDLVEIAPAINAAANRQFAKEMAGNVAHQSAGGKLSVDTTSPATMFDNVSRYYLLAIKGRFMGEMFDDALARNEKITMLQEVTGDSLARWVLAQEGVAGLDGGGFVDGARISEHPHLGHVLKRCADRMLSARGTDGLGNSIELRVEGFDGWLQGFNDDVDDMGFQDWRVNTLDKAREVSEEAGMTFADISKRAIEFSNDEDGNVIVSSRSIPSKMETVNQFNNGMVDVVAFNNSAATGLSMQSSPFEGVDVRRRLMIFMSFLKNIADHRQGEGRIDRTGQVVPPRYAIPNSGFVSDDRLASLFNRGNRNLTSMTAGSRESDKTVTEAIDLLNPIGNIAVGAVLARRPDIAERLGMVVSDDSAMMGDLGRKLLGRSFILGPDESAAIMAEVDMVASTIVERLDREGSNPLKLGRYDWKAETEVVDILQEGDDDAPTMAGLPLKLLELKVDEPKHVEQPSRVIDGLHDWFSGRSQPFERMDLAFDTHNTAPDGRTPNFDHPLFGQASGREKMGMQGMLFPVPMPSEVMDELYRTYQNFESRFKRSEDLSSDVRLDASQKRKISENAAASFLRDHYLETPDGAPDTARAERYGDVHKFITSSLAKDKKPLFAEFDFARPMRSVADRVRSVAELRQAAELLVPGRLVAIDSRALPPRMQGHFGDVYNEFGADQDDRTMFVPALITSVRYEEDRPLAQSAMRIGFFVPGTERSESLTLSGLRSNMDTALSKDGVDVVPPPPIKPFEEFAKPFILESQKLDVPWSQVAKPENFLTSSLFGVKADAVIDGFRRHYDESVALRQNLYRSDKTGAQKSVAMSGLDIAVRPGGVVEPLASDLFTNMADGLPQGTVTRKRYALVGNLISAAAAVSGKGNKSLGEKVVFSDSAGTNVNAFLLSQAQQKSVVAQVKQKTAARSDVRRDLAGDGEKIAAYLDLQRMLVIAQNGPTYGQDSIFLGPEDSGRLTSALATLYPSVFPIDDLDAMRELNGEAVDLLSRSLLRLKSEPNAFPPSLMVGGDVWSHHTQMLQATARAMGSKKASTISFPTSVVVAQDENSSEGVPVTRVRMNTSLGSISDSLSSMPKEQLVALFGSDAKVTLVGKKNNPLFKSDVQSEAVGNFLKRSGQTLQYDMERNGRLKKGTFSAVYDLSDSLDHSRLVSVLQEASKGSDADFLVGGFSKSINGALSTEVREMEKAKKRSALGLALSDDGPSKHDRPTLDQPKRLDGNEQNPSAGPSR